MFFPVVATSNLFGLLESKSGMLLRGQAFHVACVISYTFNLPKHIDVHYRQIHKAGSHRQSAFLWHWNNLRKDLIAHEPSCYQHELLTLPKRFSTFYWLAIAVANACIHHDTTIWMEEAYSRQENLPTLSAGNLSIFLYSSNRLFGGGAANAGNATQTFCFSVPGTSKLTRVTVES